MKIQIPKKISINFVLRTLLVVLILTEAYLVYSNLYGNLNPQAQTVPSNNIIRVNRSAFKQVGDFLDSLDNFQPAPPILTNADPFNAKP